MKEHVSFLFSRKNDFQRSALFGASSVVTDFPFSNIIITTSSFVIVNVSLVSFFSRHCCFFPSQIVLTAPRPPKFCISEFKVLKMLRYSSDLSFSVSFILSGS